MVSRNIVISLLLIMIQFSGSCTRNDPDPDDQYQGLPFLKNRGAFIISEGNFMQGNGSISFYSCDSGQIFNDLFATANNRPAGDIPFSMTMANDGKLCLVVNNSGKIEVIDRDNMESVQIIPDLISPRYMLIVNPDKAYVSSLYSENLTVIDLKTGSVTGTINLGSSSEAMILFNNKAFVCSWVEGSEIYVIDTGSDQVIDTLLSGHEPESMVFDRNNNLWVLCSGGYAGLYYPELLCFDLSDNTISRRFVFPSKDEMPSSLSVNPGRDTLYYINNGVWSLGINDISLPENPLIERRGRNFYRIGVDSGTGNIFATNAMDYQTRGYLMIFKADGTVIDSLRTGIIPGNLYFVDDAE